jgi:hypothetical protein
VKRSSFGVEFGEEGLFENNERSGYVVLTKRGQTRERSVNLGADASLAHNRTAEGALKRDQNLNDGCNPT